MLRLFLINACEPSDEDGTKRNFKQKIRGNNCSSAASGEQQVWLGKRNQ